MIDFCSFIQSSCSCSCSFPKTAGFQSSPPPLLLQMPRTRQVRQRLNFSAGDDVGSCRGTEAELRFLSNDPKSTEHKMILNGDFPSFIKSPAPLQADLRDTETMRSSSTISHRQMSSSRQRLTSIGPFRKSYNVITSPHASILCRQKKNIFVFICEIFYLGCY